MPKFEIKMYLIIVVFYEAIFINFDDEVHDYGIPHCHDDSLERIPIYTKGVTDSPLQNATTAKPRGLKSWLEKRHMDTG
uniref:Uncharacterized protein n=1 Tax=Lepeophtheirus salmonis TaxID=72036 RepID=A0A0K2TSR3_LEPSM